MNKQQRYTKLRNMVFEPHIETSAKSETRTFLFLAFFVCIGNEKIVELLIKAGADVNYQNIDGHAPIHISVRHGTSKVSDLLVKAHADLNLKNFGDNFPYKMAQRPEYRVRFDNVLKMNGKKVSPYGYIEDDTKVLLDAAYKGTPKKSFRIRFSSSHLNGW